MNSRKHRKLKRNPLVRFIRGVFRLLRVIFRPKNRNLRSLQEPQIDLAQVAARERQLQLERERQLQLEQERQAQFITVGELLEQIKWQIPAETAIQTNRSDLSATPQPYDNSRN